MNWTGLYELVLVDLLLTISSNMCLEKMDQNVKNITFLFFSGVCKVPYLLRRLDVPLMDFVRDVWETHKAARRQQLTMNPERLYSSCAFMSGLTHHPHRQAHVQICRRAEGSTPDHREKLPIIYEHNQSWFKIFVLSSNTWFLSTADTWVRLQLLHQPLSRTLKAPGMCGSKSTQVRQVLHHSADNPLGFWIAFIVWFARNCSKVTRRNHSPACHAFPEGGME